MRCSRAQHVLLRSFAARGRQGAAEGLVAQCLLLAVSGH